MHGTAVKTLRYGVLPQNGAVHTEACRRDLVINAVGYVKTKDAKTKDAKKHDATRNSFYQ